MKLLLVLNIFSYLSFHFQFLYNTNLLLEEAEGAYARKNYITCLQKYKILEETYHYTNDEMLVNKAHCYYMLGFNERAEDVYKSLVRAQNLQLRAGVLLQLGIINAKNGKEDIALHYFKEALKADPDYEYARLNYEFLKSKKVLNNSETNSSKKQNDDGEFSGTGSVKKNLYRSNHHQNTYNPGEDGKARGDEITDNKKNKADNSGQNDEDALQNSKKELYQLTPAQAEAILKSMRDAEVQYFQQLKIREPDVKRDALKPDW